MNWSEEESKNFLTLIASSFNLGFFVSCLLFIQLRNISPHKISIVVKFLLFLSSFGFTVPNGYTMAICRFVQGISVGVLLSSGNTNTYQGALPEHRKVALPMLTVYFAVAFIIVTVLSLFDDEGKLIWKIIYWVQGLFAFLDFFIQAVFLRKIHPVMFEIKEKGEDKAKKMLGIYLSEEKSEEIIQEFSRALSILIL